MTRPEHRLALLLLLLVPMAWGRVLLQRDLREQEGDFNGLYLDDSNIDQWSRDSDPNAPHSSPTVAQEEELGEPLSPEEFNHQFAQFDPVIVGPSDVTEVDPIELADMFEGDIMLSSEEEAMQQLSDSLMKGKSIPMNDANINVWSEAVIPYTIARSYNGDERGVIARAIKTFHDKTCIRLVHRTNQDDYIHFTKGHGCSSMVGRHGGRQIVSLGEGCIYAGIVMHEIMHAAGFWHEQSRSDRDQHIQIHWDNIKSSARHNFNVHDFANMANLGLQYDLASIMHYGRNSFAINRNRDTITPRDRILGQKMGQRTELSEIDIKELNMLYQCNGKGTKKPVTSVITTGTTGTNTHGNTAHCDYWAKIGECKKNPNWMHKSCAGSCEKYGCDDYDQHCAAWAAAGECQRNPTYMLHYCKISCGLCNSTLKDSGGECVNDHEHCEAWAAGGNCHFYDALAIMCAKSCTSCSP